MSPSQPRARRRFTDEEYRSILAFRDQLRRFLHWSETQARAAGLTAAQHQLLLVIRGHGGDLPPTIGEIAEHLQLRHHSTVELVDRAEAIGLVIREPDVHDRRISRVRLQPRGEAALEHLTALHISELRTLAESGWLLKLPAEDG